MNYALYAVKANFYAYICELKNNRGYVFILIFWPYVMAFFMLGLGCIIGNIDEYSNKMNVSNPLLYILATSSIMLSSINIVDNVAGELLRHKWIGTLPYILSSPTKLPIYAIIGPLPATVLSSFISISAILPIVFLLEGLIGGLKLFVILGLIYIGMIPLMGLAVIIGGLSLLAGEDTNIAGFLTPFILLVSGVFYPQTILPYVFQLISRVFPLVYIIEATKILATFKYPSFSLIYSFIGILLFLSLIYNIISSPGIFWIEKKVLEKSAYEE